ncbi:MBL fold metallo-hydrolase [Seohaeicola saemankumensis]|uniref:MBL fold metallo-hydrolase n=1 Tax=Seohaeicola saemankumensis TaxID=481181 RepID=A0ABW3T8A7_9RHOB
MTRPMPVLAALLALVLGAGHAQAQQRTPSHCIAVAQSAPGLEYLHKASFRDPLPDDTVRISYLAHASFLIQTQGGLSAVTDFTGFIGNVDMIPDVVTMNHAHSTHWTAAPDPAIPHVLRGWGETFGAGVEHYLDLGEMLVRNVSTDIRSFGGVEPRGNSIFIFEVAGLCIGHLGHLHQEPSPEQYAAIGRLDVVMAPVDGGLTLDIESMMRVVGRLRSSVVIPMHWFGESTLRAFVAGMSDQFAVIDAGASQVELSLRSLPRQPTIMLLQPAWLTEAQ